MSEYRAGFVGMLGYPNAGKSSLFNLLLGENLAIVTKKPQTTRKRIDGILTEDDAQYIFVDAPGVVWAEKGLNSFLNREWEDVLRSVDVLAVLFPIDEKNPEKIKRMIEVVKEVKKPCVAVITKVDLKKYRHRIAVIQQQLGEIPSIEISSLQPEKEMKKKFLEKIKAFLPESPAPLYDEDLLTTTTVKDIASEYIREQCFLQLFEEIPYGMAVTIRKFDESQKEITRIYADLIVDKEAHKSIVIGSKGQKLKTIGTSARKNIEKQLDTKVYLELHVKCRKDWQYQLEMMEAFGYVLP